LGGQVREEDGILGWWEIRDDQVALKDIAHESIPKLMFFSLKIHTCTGDASLARGDGQSPEISGDRAPLFLGAIFDWPLRCFSHRKGPQPEVASIPSIQLPERTIRTLTNNIP
jgi:hypothetical protein